jgi:hypothetical protein
VKKLDEMMSYMAHRLFKPMATLFLRNYVPYKTAAKWLKQAYVDVAQNNPEFAIEGKKHTKSRIAVITGLTRVDVDHVLKMPALVNVSEQNWNRATKVISGWISDSEYLDDSSQPKVIPLKGEISFESLVKKYSCGITARAVKDELLHIKSVEVKGNEIRLLRKEYIYTSTKDKEIALENISLSVGGLLDTITHNTQQNNDHKLFQRLVIQRNVPASMQVSLENYINQASAQFLYSLDQELTQKLKNLPVESEENNKTIGLGLYYYEN